MFARVTIKTLRAIGDMVVRLPPGRHELIIEQIGEIPLARSEGQKFVDDTWRRYSIMPASVSEYQHTEIGYGFTKDPATGAMVGNFYRRPA